jgi:hypothetical protein
MLLLISIELEWPYKPMFCQSLVYPFDIFKKATLLSVVLLLPLKFSPFPHLRFEHPPDPPFRVVIEKLPVRRDLAVFSRIL